MNAYINQLINRHHGYLYVTAGVIYAFFRDAQDAHDCAVQLQAFVENLHILGSQLTFVA